MKTNTYPHTNAFTPMPRYHSHGAASNLTLKERAALWPKEQECKTAVAWANTHVYAHALMLSAHPSLAEVATARLCV